MAPVAIQCIWSMQASSASRQAVHITRTKPSAEQRKAMFAFNLNTCHVWDEHGEQVALVESGQTLGPPLWAANRMAELGIDPSEWEARMHG